MQRQKKKSYHLTQRSQPFNINKTRIFESQDGNLFKDISHGNNVNNINLSGGLFTKRRKTGTTRDTDSLRSRLSSGNLLKSHRDKRMVFSNHNSFNGNVASFFPSNIDTQASSSQFYFGNIIQEEVLAVRNPLNGIKMPQVINYDSNNCSQISYNPSQTSGNQQSRRKENSKKKEIKKKRNYQKIVNPENYEIDLNKEEVDPRTSLMIKNIPNKYTQEMVLSDVDKNFKNKYDFFYLPIDFEVNF